MVSCAQQIPNSLVGLRCLVLGRGHVKWCHEVAKPVRVKRLVFVLFSSFHFFSFLKEKKRKEKKREEKDKEKTRERTERYETKNETKRENARPVQA